ncbi:hypothetical protein GFD17_01025 [Bifidobacterium sp. SMB2]|uniref:DUF5590 domain-containing protein n=1 Tax=Bifidobacterium saimiriisciurei TaxID=2661627 RepID=A0ABX0C8I1_9BIFI|nr:MULTISPECIES: hypothetical protein [Bifidobacterium]NEG95360.1 hypothetical protein [Bifidobacterium sp. SMB2]NEH11456.1 hypothetical protein [Bifidobacterium saimiriisciurei]
MTGQRVKHKDNRSKRHRLYWGLASVIVLALIIGFVVWKGVPYVQEKRAEAAAPALVSKVDSECNPDVEFSETAYDKEIMVTEDGGKSMTLLSGKDSSKKTLDCMLTKYGMPDDLKQKILDAKMDDGLKTERWNGMNVTWIYNNNTGLQVTLETLNDK